MSTSHNTDLHNLNQDSVTNLNPTAVTPPDSRARELRTNIDRLLLQIAENNAASHRAIGRQFALEGERE